MDRWQGRVAMVTGASSGIGAAIAEELVKNGLKVIGLARRLERMQKLSTDLQSEAGKLFAVKCDITKETDLKAAFQWIKSNLGGVDILINNAGMNSPNSITDGPEESWKAIFDLNVLALSACTKEVLQSMSERGVEDGHIIHINSVCGHIIPPTEFPVFMYAASKHAVTTLTEGLRRELVAKNSRIKITSVSPGVVMTDLISESMHAYPHLYPADIANAVLYILGTPSHVQIHELTIKPIGEKV